MAIFGIVFVYINIQSFLNPPYSALFRQGATYMSLKKPSALTCGQSGFTLLELMVVIAIGAILAGLAVGALQIIIPRSQVKSAAQQLRTDLQKAKMEAVKNNRECLVTFTEANGTKGSYQACFDDDGNNACDSGETIIAQNTFTDKNYKHAELSNVALALGSSFLRFNSRGMPSHNGTVDINCLSDANYSLSVILSTVGRIRIE